MPSERSTPEAIPPRVDIHSLRPNDAIVVTGASAGVGRAITRELAKRGARIGLLARGQAGLEATRKEVEQLGGHALAIPTDVADANAVEAAADRVERELGPIAVWINDAMTTVFSPVAELSPAEYRRVTEVTYLGSVWGTMAALERMRPRRRGSIVCVGSALAYRGIPLQSAYCGAKHAIRGFIDSLRSELLHDQIPIELVMVQLPGINTPQFSWCASHMDRCPQPVPPIFQPEVAARAVVRAIGSGRREIYVAGPTYKTIIGQKLAPRFLDHYLAHAAWEGQLRDQRAPADRASNLFAPVERDAGAHGDFDDRALGQTRLGWTQAPGAHGALLSVGIVVQAALIGFAVLAIVLLAT